MSPERHFPWDGQVESMPGRPTPREFSMEERRIAADWDELSRLRFDSETVPTAEPDEDADFVVRAA